MHASQFIISIYSCPVQVRVYELDQLSMKFERHFDAEIVDFQANQSYFAGAQCSLMPQPAQIGQQAGSFGSDWGLLGAADPVRGLQ